MLQSRCSGLRRLFSISTTVIELTTPTPKPETTVTCGFCTYLKLFDCTMPEHAEMLKCVQLRMRGAEDASPRVYQPDPMTTSVGRASSRARGSNKQAYNYGIFLGREKCVVVSVLPGGER